MRSRERLALAARYTLHWRRGYLSSFLSLLSMLGLVLAVALLILVLSVMNGFDREMRENILVLVPQLVLKSWGEGHDWEGVAETVSAHQQVIATAPFVELQGMLVRGARVETALMFGVSAEQEAAFGSLARVLDDTTWQEFSNSDDGVLLGSGLARQLGVSPGDRLTLIVPQPGGRGGDTRYQHLQLSGLLHSGTELDETAAFLHLEMAQRLRGGGGIDGYRLRLENLFLAPRVGWELVNALPPGVYARDWTQTHGNLYAAIQMSRDLVVILLLSIIAIAAFNVVSSLVLVVVDKRSDIAILRAMGASPRHITGIFLRQGLLIAMLGAGFGTLLGVSASAWVTEIVATMEAVLGIRFLNTDVYPIGYLPSDLRWSDVVVINAVALGLCFLAALYPARRAAGLPPAEALRHE